MIFLTFTDNELLYARHIAVDSQCNATTLLTYPTYKGGNQILISDLPMLTLGSLELFNVIAVSGKKPSHLYPWFTVTDRHIKCFYHGP